MHPAKVQLELYHRFWIIKTCQYEFVNREEVTLSKDLL